MKVAELFDEAKPIKEARMTQTKGSWKIGNLSGNFKTFKDPESAEALAWMRDRTPPGPEKKEVSKAEKDRLQREREYAKREREDERAAKQAKAAAKKDLISIWRKVEDAVASAFPDGEPIERLIPYMKKNDLEMKDIDKAVRKYGQASSLNKYLAQMWKDTAADAIHDAKIALSKGEHIDSSPYYSVENKKVVATPNPWK